MRWIEAVPMRRALKLCIWSALAFVAVVAIQSRTYGADALNTWHFRTNHVLNKVRFAGGIFIGLGRGGLLVTSSNGLDWITRQSGTAADLRGAAYGASFFPTMPATYVVVGSRATILTSTNAMDWILNPTTNTCDLNGVAYTTSLSGRFVAVTSRFSDDDPNALRSNGETNWSRVSFPGAPAFVGPVVAAGPYLIAAGGSQIVMDAWRSAGSSWQRVTNVGQAGCSIAYGEGRTIMVGMQGWPMISTDDGASWFRSTNILFQSDMVATDIAYGNGTFLVARYLNPLQATPDGIVWRVIPFQGRIWSVAYGNGTFVLAAEDGIYQSDALAAARISALGELNSQELLLTITGEIGRSYRLQNSSNILDWSDYLAYSNAAPTTNILVPILPTHDQFFRVVTP